MTIKKMTVEDRKANNEKVNSQLTLAALYLEESLKEGSSIEIPSLGVSISNKGVIKIKKENT